jgi:hypothetical protein
MAFRNEYGESIVGHSDIRWYCSYEQAKQHFLHFDAHLPNWVVACETAGYIPQTILKLRQLVFNQRSSLHLELSINHDVFDMFISKTYTWEGDETILVFRIHSDVHELIEHVALCRATTKLVHTKAIASTIVTLDFPRLLAAAAQTKVDELVAEQLAKVEPAFLYFDVKLTELKVQIDMYEAFTMFHPLLASHLNLAVPGRVRDFAARVPCLNKPGVLAGLEAELSRYLSEVALTPVTPWKECDIESLWQESRFRKLPFWHSAALNVMLHQPSSAPIERVFSILKYVVGDQQGGALEDYQCGAMMMNYNSRERN